MKSLDEILKMDNPSEYLYEYARENGRLEPKWEELLLSFGDPRWLYFYAYNIIKERWLEAEKYIKKNPHWTCWYAYDIIKGRWSEAEEIIKKNPAYAYLYVRDIIKGRWEEAEEHIKKDPYWWRRYNIECPNIMTEL